MNERIGFKPIAAAAYTGGECCLIVVAVYVYLINILYIKWEIKRWRIILKLINAESSWIIFNVITNICPISYANKYATTVADHTDAPSPLFRSLCLLFGCLQQYYVLEQIGFPSFNLSLYFAPIMRHLLHERIGRLV